MKHAAESHERSKEIRRLEAERRIAAQAKKLLKINSNYDPFWNISPQAPRVQRIGVGILGMFFLFVGVCMFCMALENHSWALFTASLFALLISMRPIWNALKGGRPRGNAPK
jgi:hypothetical protein